MQPIGPNHFAELKAAVESKEPPDRSVIIEIAAKVLEEANAGQLSSKETLELIPLSERILTNYNAPEVVQALYDKVISLKDVEESTLERSPRSTRMSPNLIGIVSAIPGKNRKKAVSQLRALQVKLDELPAEFGNQISSAMLELVKKNPEKTIDKLLDFCPILPDLLEGLEGEELVYFFNEVLRFFEVDDLAQIIPFFEGISLGEERLSMIRRWDSNGVSGSTLESGMEMLIPTVNSCLTGDERVDCLESFSEIVSSNRFGSKDIKSVISQIELSKRVAFIQMIDLFGIDDQSLDMSLKVFSALDDAVVEQIRLLEKGTLDRRKLAILYKEEQEKIAEGIGSFDGVSERIKEIIEKSSESAVEVMRKEGRKEVLAITESLNADHPGDVTRALFISLKPVMKSLPRDEQIVLLKAVREVTELLISRWGDAGEREFLKVFLNGIPRLLEGLDPLAEKLYLLEKVTSFLQRSRGDVSDVMALYRIAQDLMSGLEVEERVAVLDELVNLDEIASLPFEIGLFLSEVSSGKKRVDVMKSLKGLNEEEAVYFLNVAPRLLEKKDLAQIVPFFEGISSGEERLSMTCKWNSSEFSEIDLGSAIKMLIPMVNSCPAGDERVVLLKAYSEIVSSSRLDSESIISVVSQVEPVKRVAFIQMLNLFGVDAQSLDRSLKVFSCLDDAVVEQIRLLEAGSLNREMLETLYKTELERISAEVDGFDGLSERIKEIIKESSESSIEVMRKGSRKEVLAITDSLAANYPADVIRELFASLKPVMKSLPRDEQIALLKAVSQEVNELLSSRWGDESERASLKMFLKSLPGLFEGIDLLAEKIFLLEKATSFLRRCSGSTSDVMGACLIAQDLMRGLEVEKRATVLEELVDLDGISGEFFDIKAFLEEGSSLNERMDVLKALLALDIRSMSDEIQSYLTNYSKVFSTEDKRSEFLRYVNECSRTYLTAYPPERAVSVFMYYCNEARSFLSKFADPSAKFTALKQLVDFVKPPTNPSDAAKALVSLTQNLPSEEEKFSYLKNLTEIGKTYDEFNLDILNVLPLLVTMDLKRRDCFLKELSSFRINDKNLSVFFKLMNSMPREEWKDFEALATPCIESVDDISKVFKTLRSINKKNKKIILSVKDRLITEKTDASMTFDIINAANRIIQSGKPETLEIALAVILQEKTTTAQKLAILLMHTPTYLESCITLAFAAPLIQSDMHEPEIRAVIDQFNGLSKREALSLAQSVAPFMKKGITKEDITLQFKKFKLIPEFSRVNCSKFIGSLFDKKASVRELCSLLDFVNMTRVFKSTKEEFFGAVIQKLKTHISTALLRKEDRKKALEIARGVLSCQDVFKVEDDTSIIRGAVETILGLEGNKSDSFYVHAHMKAVRSSCTAPIEEMIESVRIATTNPKGVSTITLSLKGLQNGLGELQKKEKTYQELKDWIDEVNNAKNPTDPFLGSKIFVDLFQNLKDRLDQQIQTYPPNETELQELKDAVAVVEQNFTHPEFLTAQLMSRPFEDDETAVPKLIERLYAIGAAILKKDNILTSEKLLSPREDAMMSVLLLIEQCAAGQEEGITVCYNSLKVAQEIPGLGDENSIQPEIENTEDYLEDEVQKIMGEVLENPETLRQLGVTEKEDFEQGVHQCKYLKSMIGEECGLNHSIGIDSHGNCVSKQLMCHSRETILRVFFRQLSKALVSSLRRDFNSLDPAPKNKLYKNLTVFLEKHGVSLGQAWAVTDLGDFELTEFGALSLLEKGKYLLPMEGEYKHYVDLESKLESTEEKLRQLQCMTPIDPKTLTEAAEAVRSAEEHRKASEKKYEKAVRVKDVELSQIKESFEIAKQRLVDAKGKLEELQSQEALRNEKFAKIGLLTKSIEIMRAELSSSRNRLENEAAIPEDSSPIPVIHDTLLEGILPADIQELETKLKNAESSFINKKAMLENCLGVESKATEESNLQEELCALELEIEDCKEAYEKARREFLRD